MLKAVIFDLDGTLYNKNAIKTNMLFRNISHLLMLFSLLDIRNKISGVDFYTKDKFQAHLFNEMEKRTHKKATSIQSWYFHEFYPGFVNLLRKKYQTSEDITNILQVLRKQSVRTAVLSDYLFARERIEAISLDSALFDIIASNEEYGVLKPSKRPLVDIAFRLGVRQEQVMVIGDREDTDGRGARMANMHFCNIKKNRRQCLSWRYLDSLSMRQ